MPLPVGRLLIRGDLSTDGHGEVRRLLLVRRRDIDELDADFLELLRLQGYGREIYFHGLNRVLSRVEPVGAVVRGRKLEDRLGPRLLDLDDLAPVIDVQNLAPDETDSLVRRAVRELELAGEPGRRVNAAGALFDMELAGEAG